MSKEQCGNLIDYFNGQLNEDEMKEFETHLQTCRSCQEELEELKELTDDLPFLSNAAEPPKGMKKRVLETVFDDESDGTEKSALQADHENKQEPFVKKDRKKVPAPLLYGSLAAALMLSLAGNGYLWNERQELSQENRQLAMERDLIESDYLALMEEEEGEGTSDVLLASNLAYTGEDESDGSGTAIIITENGNVDLVIQVSDMPPAAGDDVFQAWIIDGETPYPAGSFNIDENGNGAVTYRISDMEDFQIDQIAITLEPQANNEAPEGPVILASQ